MSLKSRGLRLGCLEISDSPGHENHSCDSPVRWEGRILVLEFLRSSSGRSDIQLLPRKAVWVGWWQMRKAGGVCQIWQWIRTAQDTELLSKQPRCYFFLIF